MLSARVRFRHWITGHGWLWIGCLWIIAIALGYIGFARYYIAAGESLVPLNLFYKTLQLFVFESGAVEAPLNWELEIARFLAPLLTIYTALNTLALIFREQLTLFRIRFLRNHVVICGLGRKGLLLARRFREQGERVVIIEQDGNNKMAGTCREYGILLFIGNAEDPGILRRAQVQRARYLISVCGDDGTNAGVAVNARKLAGKRRGKALVCLAHIFDTALYSLLREQEIAKGEPDKFRLEFFNVFESGARILLGEYPPFTPGRDTVNAPPKIIVIGGGWMGESIIVNAAYVWKEEATGKRLRITLIDREAERIAASLYSSYPQLDKSCELVPKQMLVESPEFEQASFLFDNNGLDAGRIYICLDNDIRALNAALTLQQKIPSLRLPAVICMSQETGLTALFEERTAAEGSQDILQVFRIFDRTCRPELIFNGTFELLARVIHDDYVRNEREKGHTVETNPSLLPWEQLPEVLKESNRHQAEYIRIKLEAVGCGITITNEWDTPPFSFTPEEIELMSKMEHERFVNERKRQGYRYGTEKNAGSKTSPTLIPWVELSEEEKEKDRNVARHIPSLLARARFRIYRLNAGNSYRTGRE